LRVALRYRTSKHCARQDAERSTLRSVRSHFTDENSSLIRLRAYRDHEDSKIAAMF
jgi:hypothetical protein